MIISKLIDLIGQR